MSILLNVPAVALKYLRKKVIVIVLLVGGTRADRI